MIRRAMVVDGRLPQRTTPDGEILASGACQVSWSRAGKVQTSPASSRTTSSTRSTTASLEFACTIDGSTPPCRQRGSSDHERCRGPSRRTTIRPPSSVDCRAGSPPPSDAKGAAPNRPGRDGRSGDDAIDLWIPAGRRSSPTVQTVSSSATTESLRRQRPADRRRCEPVPRRSARSEPALSTTRPSTTSSPPEEVAVRALGTRRQSSPVPAASSIVAHRLRLVARRKEATKGSRAPELVSAGHRHAAVEQRQPSVSAHWRKPVAPNGATVPSNAPCRREVPAHRAAPGTPPRATANFRPPSSVPSAAR